MSVEILGVKRQWVGGIIRRGSNMSSTAFVKCSCEVKTIVIEGEASFECSYCGVINFISGSDWDKYWEYMGNDPVHL